jgi:hypothetical protein
MQTVQIKVSNKGYYPFRDETLPFVVNAEIDCDGDAYVSGLELHEIEPERFPNDNFTYVFAKDVFGFEVVS